MRAGDSRAHENRIWDGAESGHGEVLLADRWRARRRVKCATGQRFGRSFPIHICQTRELGDLVDAGSEELAPTYILYDKHLCRDAMLPVTLMTLVRPSGPVVPAGHRTEVWKCRGTTSEQPITPTLMAPIHQIVPLIDKDNVKDEGGL